MQPITSKGWATCTALSNAPLIQRSLNDQSVRTDAVEPIVGVYLTVELPACSGWPQRAAAFGHRAPIALSVDSDRGLLNQPQQIDMQQIDTQQIDATYATVLCTTVRAQPELIKRAPESLR